MGAEVVCANCGVGAVPNLDSALKKVALTRRGYRARPVYVHKRVQICALVGRVRAQAQELEEEKRKAWGYKIRLWWENLRRRIRHRPTLAAL